MRTALIDIYRQVIFDTGEPTMRWFDRVIVTLAAINPVEDPTANFAVAGALCEMRTIRSILQDQREFPELREVMPREIHDTIPIVTSFLGCSPDLINSLHDPITEPLRRPPRRMCLPPIGPPKASVAVVKSP